MGDDDSRLDGATLGRVRQEYRLLSTRLPPCVMDMPVLHCSSQRHTIQLVRLPNFSTFLVVVFREGATTFINVQSNDHLLQRLVRFSPTLHPAEAARIAKDRLFKVLPRTAARQTAE